MRAVQLVTAGAALEMREVAVPEPGPGEILIRIAAAGICRSDLHYRSGFPAAGPLPLTLGHEVAGIVVADAGTTGPTPGARVCVHYQVGCGRCRWCAAGLEQHCPTGSMVGKSRPGGYAEMITVPARNAVPIPPGVTMEHAAAMMCSSATSLHALRRGRLAPGDRVAIFGVGGLGMSAVQLAQAGGAATVFAIDPNPEKRRLAETLGAEPLAPGAATLDRIRAAGGADLAMDLVGSAEVMRRCLEVLAPLGRAVAVGLTPDTFAVGPYTDLVTGESELIGASDHRRDEIVDLLDMAASGGIRLDRIVDRTVPLEAGPINRTLDELAGFGGSVRTVITP
jgi:2-desacetyl-2-hydroxyethyl bacteriochlorophyllide A dehydrogenase